MGLFSGMDTSASGLTAQRLRMDTISNNVANANTTRTEDGEPYRRKLPVFASRLQEATASSGAKGEAGTGVKVTEIHESDEPPKLEYDPGHPDADEEGYVAKPNINIVSEMTDMISANRSYEANVTALESGKEMAKSALNLGG